MRRFDERLRCEMGRGAVTYTLELKFDGLSVELVYERGRLARASTRGEALNATLEAEGKPAFANPCPLGKLPDLLRRRRSGDVETLHRAGGDPRGASEWMF